MPTFGVGVALKTRSLPFILRILISGLASQIAVLPCCRMRTCTNHACPGARSPFGVELSPTVAMQPAEAVLAATSTTSTIATKLKSFTMTS